MDPPSSAEQVLSWWKKGDVSFLWVLLLTFITAAKNMKCNLLAGLRCSDLEHSAEAEGDLSQEPPAALSPLLVVGLSSSLDQPIPTFSII